MLSNYPTAEQVIAHLDESGRDASMWLGTHGASPTPGMATIRHESSRGPYEPTYGYIRFAGEQLCWRVWSQRAESADPTEQTFRPERFFLGRDLIAELKAASKSDLLSTQVLRNDQWVDI